MEINFNFFLDQMNKKNNFNLDLSADYSEKELSQRSVA